MPAASDFVPLLWMHHKVTLGEREDEVRRAIVQGRSRAHSLLGECGCQNIIEISTSVPGSAVSVQDRYRLFDVLLGNPLDQPFPATYFLDRIDEAIGMLQWRQEAAQPASSQEPKTIASPSDDLRNTIGVLHFLAHRFPHVAASLAQRRNGHAPFEIRNEYDVQDLFFALLQVVYDDVRREEHTPSLAGTSARIDIMLAGKGVMIEVKMTRAGLDQRKVKEQLLVDIPQYCGHPNCKALVAFVYDPERRIENPSALENDLSRNWEGIPVHVFVVQG